MATTSEQQNQNAETKRKDNLQRPQDDNKNQSAGNNSDNRDEVFQDKKSDPKKNGQSKEQDQSSGQKNY